MNFDSIEKMLTQAYARKQVGAVTYFMKDERVVATKANDCIVMYFACDRRVIWSHHRIVAVAVIKNFELVDMMQGVCGIKRADVLIVNGIGGTNNTVRKNGDRHLEVTTDCNLTFSYYKDCKESQIGTIGTVKGKGVFEFEDLKIILEVQEDMCEYNVIALNYFILERKPYLLIRDIQESDYDLYNYLKIENEWFWKAGLNTIGSNQVRSQIEHTKTANYHKLAEATITILRN